MAGGGLWLEEAGNERIVRIEGLPVTPTEVEAMGPDPDHADGVILFLRGRGMLRVTCAAI